MEADPAAISFREMRREDIAACLAVRLRVRENRYSAEQLRNAGASEASMADKLVTSHRGWVGQVGDSVAGFCMADGSTGELWVIAVAPEHEGRGMGRRLMELAQDWLRSVGWKEIWLWTAIDGTTRAYGLYRKLGWHDAGLEGGRRILRLRVA